MCCQKGCYDNKIGCNIMDKIRLRRIIDASDNEYETLYSKINEVSKEQTGFDYSYYYEMVWLSMYLFHLKFGIDKLSNRGIIPKFLSKVDSYDEFKCELEKCENIPFHHDSLPDINNILEEIINYLYDLMSMML